MAKSPVWRPKLRLSGILQTLEARNRQAVDGHWSYVEFLSRLLEDCEFIRQKHNLLSYGPTGTGKTHLAQAIVHEAARQGFDAVFTTTHKMLQHINGGRADDRWERRLQIYLRPTLLVLDDFGLKYTVGQHLTRSTASS